MKTPDEEVAVNPARPQIEPQPPPRCRNKIPGGGRKLPPSALAFLGKIACGLQLLNLLQAPAGAAVSPVGVIHDVANKRIVLADADHQLVLRLNYDGRCLLDQVSVRGREVVGGDTGVWSAMKTGDQWFTTRSNIPTPQVAVTSNTVTVTGIRFGGGDVAVAETWRFTVQADRIVWRIDRTYASGGTLADTGFPAWNFHDLSVWTGALLGSGGVAWNKLFDAPNASYGVHNGKITFWNQERRAGLRLVPTSPTDSKIAVRFSRQPDGVLSLNYYVTENAVVPKHGHSRFRRDRQDIWQPFTIRPGPVSVELTLSALDYDQAYDLGHFAGLDGGSLRQICHTIARIGVVDELFIGSNGYYSDVAVLHEPWIALMGLAIGDAEYFRALGDTLDYQRQHAIGTDGRVKSRWAGGPGDEMPGTYDALGFYECQWGWLLDSQPSWVINVAELFDFTGDRDWLQRQKSTAERVLDYLLARDTDGDGLVEMMTDSHREAKGSDWIDVVWAAHENALVNAQMYWAMVRWADLEELLADSGQARRYRGAAEKLKRRFNQNTGDGGFWDPQNQCYAYWRDKDGSVHGTNLVVPVNFSALGYGLCDEPARRTVILDRLESLMKQEQLFFWPLCLFSYAKEEVHPKVNWPFPAYENGDLFLAWGELGTRAYAAHDPTIALKYVKNVLTQYAQDGLAFQRYLRKTQTGAGNDILANNCNIVVGLYRNLYGVQPKYNRLYLEPHLNPELNGTRLIYGLRGQEYQIDLSVSNYSIAVGPFVVRDRQPFAVNVAKSTLEYFVGPNPTNALAITTTAAAPLELAITSWPESASAPRTWSESCRQPGTTAHHVIAQLSPHTAYALSRNGQRVAAPPTDAAGCLAFDCTFTNATPQNFALSPEGQNE